MILEILDVLRHLLLIGEVLGGYPLPFLLSDQGLNPLGQHRLRMFGRDIRTRLGQIEELLVLQCLRRGTVRDPVSVILL